MQVRKIDKKGGKGSEEKIKRHGFRGHGGAILLLVEMERDASKRDEDG